MKVYVIRSEKSCYDDFHSAAVAAFLNKEMAEQYIYNITNLLKSFAKDIKEIFPLYNQYNWGGDYKNKNGQEKFDEAMIQFKNIEKYYEEKLKEYDVGFEIKSYHAYGNEYFIDEVELIK